MLVTALAALVVAAPGGSKSVPALFGKVGPGKTISLKTRAGKPVRTLKAGTYHLQVVDLTKRSNFHMLGRGVNLATPVRKKGSYGWSLRVTRGTYRFFSDPQRKRLKGSFKVTS